MQKDTAGLQKRTDKGMRAPHWCKTGACPYFFAPKRPFITNRVPWHVACLMLYARWNTRPYTKGFAHPWCTVFRDGE
jgi:hypothetical protein